MSDESSSLPASPASSFEAQKYSRVGMATILSLGGMEICLSALVSEGIDVCMVCGYVVIAVIN